MYEVRVRLNSWRMENKLQIIPVLSALDTMKTTLSSSVSSFQLRPHHAPDQEEDSSLWPLPEFILSTMMALYTPHHPAPCYSRHVYHLTLTGTCLNTRAVPRTSPPPTLRSRAPMLTWRAGPSRPTPPLCLPGQARVDWKIIRVLSEVLDEKLLYDKINEESSHG